MTTDNTCEEIECEDGVTRPVDDCVETPTGWWSVDDCVEVNGTWYQMGDDDICYVERHDEWYLVEDCTVVEGDWEHDSDVSCCDSCHEAFYDGDLSDDPSGGHICDSCMSAHCSDCTECGELCWDEDMTDGLCESCEEASGGLICNYSDKSANRLRSETTDRLRFGIELEVEGYNSAEEAAEYIRRFLPVDYCTLKRDGSLGSSGVEIVTRPDSMAVHKQKFQPFFDDSPGRELSSWNTGRCGMHVHVSRSALSQLQVGKMLCFVNDPAAANFLAKVAGRRPCNWCKVHKKKITDCKYDDDRYAALNISGHRTVEFRIFKGTLAPSGFHKNLEFVAALVEYTAPCSRSIAEATSYRAFCEWLPRKQYPHLYAFLKTKGFMRARRAA
jgi:hypothetical protein